MGCCEKEKYDRLKNIEHASVLASQQAHLLNKRMAVVKQTHHHYGEHYIGIPYSEAERKELKIYREYYPGKSMKKSTPARNPQTRKKPVKSKKKKSVKNR